MDKKEISARKFMVICFTLTYCALNIGNVILTIIKIMELNTYIACWSAFNTPMILIAEWYFKREDRQVPEPKQEVVK